jgi:ribonuclease P protein component
LNKQLSFPRDHRLVSKADYKSVFDKSFKVNQKHLVVLFKPNEKPHARLGLVIGKRVANSAVARNQIKRVMRESFRLNHEQLKGLDIIIIGRQQCDTLDKTKLREGIDRLWEKLLISYRTFLP